MPLTNRVKLKRSI